MNQYPDFDQKLYDDLRRGKEYAFAAVFERYNRLLYTIAYRFLKSEEEAEDAIQYLFMKLWEQRTNFSFESGIRSLLFTILKNYILNELRHRSLVFEKLYEMAQQVNDEDEDDFLTQFENGELGKFLRVAIDEGGNLAASKIRNLECPSYEIYLIDYGCGKFNRKIHIMEQYP